MEYVKHLYGVWQIVSAQNTLAIKGGRKGDRRESESAKRQRQRGRWLVTQGQPSLTRWKFDSPTKDTER